MRVSSAALTAATVLAMTCAGCASQPADPSAEREQKIYRTGSNIPAKDYGSEHVEHASPDVINPVNRPMPSSIGRRPGG